MTDLALQVSHLAAAVKALTEFNAVLIKKLDQVSAPDLSKLSIPDNKQAFETLHIKLDALGEYAAAMDAKLDKIGELTAALALPPVNADQKVIKSK